MSANPAKGLRADWLAFMEGACISDVPTVSFGQAVKELPGRGEDKTSIRSADVSAAAARDPQMSKPILIPAD